MGARSIALATSSATSDPREPSIIRASRQRRCGLSNLTQPGGIRSRRFGNLSERARPGAREIDGRQRRRRTTPRSSRDAPGIEPSWSKARRPVRSQTGLQARRSPRCARAVRTLFWSTAASTQNLRSARRETSSAGRSRATRRERARASPMISAIAILVRPARTGGRSHRPSSSVTLLAILEPGAHCRSATRPRTASLSSIQPPPNSW